MTFHSNQTLMKALARGSLKFNNPPPGIPRDLSFRPELDESPRPSRTYCLLTPQPATFHCQRRDSRVLLDHRLVKAFTSRAEDPGFESRLRRDFSTSSHTSDLTIGTPVATLPGAWRCRVSAGTDRLGVSIL